MPAGDDVGAQHREDLVDVVLLAARRRRRPDVELERVAAPASSWLSVHHGCPPSRAAVRASSNSMNPDAPSASMSIGASPPTAAVDHDASRNSRPVLIRSAARVRTFSGSQISTGVPAGRWSDSVREVGGTQQRQQRLHAVDGDALGQLGQHVGHAARHAVLQHRVLGGQLGGAVADVVGEQQLAARHRDQRVDVDLRDGPLVGDGEHPHLRDLVAPELDAHRMLGGRREDVEDAAAHRELTALADHVDAGVGQVDEPGDDVVELGLGADGQRDRLDVGEVGRHRLQQRPRRRHDDPQRRAEPLVVGVGQPAQQHQARTDGVDARREPLVRQRLPGREQRDRVTEHAAQLGGQVVGLAPGRGDDEQRARLGERATRRTPGRWPGRRGRDRRACRRHGGRPPAGRDRAAPGRRGPRSGSGHGWSPMRS